MDFLTQAPAGIPAWLWVTILAVVKASVVLGFAAVNALVLIWADRKVAGRFQFRVGPEVTGGPGGILQSLADGVKLFGKEDVMPAAADRWLWGLAPAVVFAPVIMVFLVIPIGPGLVLGDLNVAAIYIIAITSFVALGIFMAGWGSNNKYSLIGAMRAIAQLVSYEIPLVLSVLGVVLLAGSLKLGDIVDKQAGLWFIVPQFIGFIVFYISTLAELNRTPFDLVIGESEIVAGYATEYSGIRWAMFFFAEYAGLVASSALAVTLFLGGWHGPFLPGPAWFFLKTYALVFVGMWIRWTLPRLRIDQVMNLGWKFLLPLGLLNLALTGAYLAFVG